MDKTPSLLLPPAAKITWNLSFYEKGRLRDQYVESKFRREKGRTLP